MRGKLKARVGPSQRELMREAVALALLQPRKAKICSTEEEYRAAPNLPGLSLDAVLQLGPEARTGMKAKQARYWGRPWDEMASDLSLLGGMATPKRRRKSD
jgi:hypothetical protein